MLGDAEDEDGDLNMEPPVEKRDVGDEMGVIAMFGMVTLVVGIMPFRRRETPDADGVRPRSVATTIRRKAWPVNGDIYHATWISPGCTREGMTYGSQHDALCVLASKIYRNKDHRAQDG